VTKPLRQVGVHEAKTHLSELLRAVAGGQEVEILRGGRPVARLVPTGGAHRRELGGDEGQLVIAEDFDAPLPSDLENSFYA
jgi:prevent-host-death family protein